MNHTVEQLSESKQRPRHCSFLPRFGLRTLLIVGVVFCLFSAWAGKHIYRVRQEQAAIEALKQAGAKFQIMGGSVGLSIGWVDAQPFEGYGSLRRLFGWTDRPVLSLVELESIEADDPKAAEAVAALTLFPEIEVVHLTGPAFDNASVERLNRLTHLESVILVNTNVTSAGISRLPPQLQCVAFGEGELTSELIEGMTSLPNLEFLHLCDLATVEPGVYAPLANASELKTLIVDNAGFADDDMQTLAELDDLEHLHVEGITDVGLARLAPMTKLAGLHVEAPVTEDAARRFSSSRPELRIVYTDAQGQRVAFIAGQAVP